MCGDDWRPGAGAGVSPALQVQSIVDSDGSKGPRLGRSRWGQYGIIEPVCPYVERYTGSRMKGCKAKRLQRSSSVEAPGERKNKITMRRIIIQKERDGKTETCGPLG